jgi:hypothetical protein
MKAFRNIGGNVVEIEVDIDLNNQPILPPDTTTDPKPVASAGHYVTVVGNSWVQIPVTQEVVAFEYKKQKAMEAHDVYKAYYLEQPITHDGVSFDADEKARARLTQAIVINGASGYLPPAWIAADNSSYALADLAALMGIVTAVQTAFATRFFEMDTIRQAINAATNEVELSAVVIPSVPSQM